MRTCPGSNGSIMRCSRAMRRIQLSDLMLIEFSGQLADPAVGMTPAARASRGRAPCAGRKIKRARIACDHAWVHGRHGAIAPAPFRAYARTRRIIKEPQYP